MKYFDVYLNKERRRMVEERRDIKRDHEALNQLKTIKQKLTSKESNITKAFNKVRDLTGQDYTPEIDNFLNVIDTAQGRLEEKIESANAMMTENQIQRSLASLGVIISMMIHEVNDAVSIAYRESNKLKKHLEGKEKLGRIELQKLSNYLIESMEKVKTWNDLVDKFSNSLTLEDIHSRREDVIYPFEITEKFISNIRKIIAIPYIEIDNKINEKLKIKMFSAYFESIIGNLMTNAVKAINASDNKQDRENKILIRSERTDQYLIIYFSDNGTGIPKERWEQIFEPHISSTTKYKLLKGHGLGLPIVHSMIREYNGDIEIVDPVMSQGTTFRIKLPWKDIDPRS
jgi:signal transduction histidine kinase